MILRSAEISGALSIFLNFLSCGTFFFKNLQFSNLSNFKGNLGIVSRPKYVVGTYPFVHITKYFGSEISVENWDFGFKIHLIQLKQLSRNFCIGSEISAKIETLKSALKHISVP